MSKTFGNLGITFEFDENCATCYNGSCHNNVISKKDEQEYNVHISTNKDKNIFNIYAVLSSNVDNTSIIEREFENEDDAVNFMCEHFEEFKCF